MESNLLIAIIGGMFTIAGIFLQNHLAAKRERKRYGSVKPGRDHDTAAQQQQAPTLPKKKKRPFPLIMSGLIYMLVPILFIYFFQDIDFGEGAAKVLVFLCGVSFIIGLYRFFTGLGRLFG